MQSKSSTCALNCVEKVESDRGGGFRVRRSRKTQPLYGGLLAGLDLEKKDNGGSLTTVKPSQPQDQNPFCTPCLGLDKISVSEPSS